MTDRDNQPASVTEIDHARGSTTLKDGGKQMALIVYILYFIGFATGITAAAGAILAHMNAAGASEFYRTHFDFQIRTFWYGLLTLVVGWLLAFVLVGYLVLAWFAVWTLVRCVKGTMRLTNEEPIVNPATLFW